MKIDKVDLKILELLSENCRENYNVLAKRVGISKQNFNYRINKLVAEDVIHSFTVKLNSGLGDCQSKFVALKVDDPIMVLADLRKRKDLVFVSYSFGRFNIIFWTRGSLEFLDNYEFSEKFTFDDIFDYVHDSFPVEKYFRSRRKKGGIFEIDKIDEKIIDLLRVDSRMSILEISDKTGFARETVQRRIKKYLDSGLVGFMALINKDKIGLEMYSLFIKSKEISRVFDYLKNRRGVGSISRNNDYVVCEFYLENLEKFYSKIKKLKGKFEIEMIEPLVIVDGKKNEFNKITN